MFKLLFLLALSTVVNANPQRSGFEDMRPETQAMQRDDAQNPGMLWVKQGAAHWQSTDNPSGKSCQSCHGEVAQSMRGVAASYPRSAGNLGQRINQCREGQQAAKAFAPESAERLSLEALIGYQSRGLAIKPDGNISEQTAKGKVLFNLRQGQLNLSCAQCHEQLAGSRLGSAPIPQAHPTGYPLYRLEWQGLGSLQRRIRNCLSGVRALPYSYDSAEMLNLEAYLMQRAAGMPLETPAVRP
jgi:L-cysteine S-thiosulfotransferase